MNPLQCYCRLNEWIGSWTHLFPMDRKKFFPISRALLMIAICMCVWVACVSFFLIDPLLAKNWNNGVLWGRGLWSILVVTGGACIATHWGFTYHFWNLRARKLRPSTLQASSKKEAPRWMYWLSLIVYIPALSILTPLAAVLGVENIYGAYLWHHTQSQLEQRGEPLQWSQWASSPVPDEDNFASHPIFALAHDPQFEEPNASSDKKLARVNTEQMLQLLNFPDKFARQHHLKKHPEAKSNPSMESWALAFKQAISHQTKRGDSSPKSLAELPNYPEAPEGSTDLETVGTALSVAEKLLDEISKASHRPHFRLPSIGDQPDFDSPFHTLRMVKKIANFLHFRSWYYLEANKPALAAEDILLTLRMAEQLKDEPLLITHLVRISLVAMASNDLATGMTKHLWTEPELNRLMHAFTQPEFLASVKTSIQRERAVASVMFHQWIQGKGPLMGADLFLPSTSKAINRLMPGWIRQTQVAYLLILQDWLDSTTPYLENADALNGLNLLDSIDPEKSMRRHSFNPHYNFANLVLPSFHKIYAKSLRIQQQCLQTTTACALERYYLKHQTYPPTLQDLVPDDIPAVPLDIMDRSALKYERTEGGTFRLWSVGIDGEDHGGDAEKDRDWVWPRVSTSNR